MAVGKQEDIRWSSPTAWGELQISINLTKPEKDPREIAKAKSNPTCVLCEQNRTEDGWLPVYPLRVRQAQPNLRIGRMDLDGETWHLQYSPYHYFEHHCIAASTAHAPMHIDRSTFGNLLRIVQAYPNFFMGSNADLPIVGGSILAHDHFQGGSHRFPMDDAKDSIVFQMAAFPQVEAAAIKWPLTVIRLKGADIDQLANAAAHVLEAWQDWSDARAGIVAETDGEPHNTITPIARKRGGLYELDLALRCNITNEEHPLGVFHPHSQLHHIKRENIGLIEVMGLAILPARLAQELEAVADCLAAGASLQQMLEVNETHIHAEWAAGVAARHPELCEGNAAQIVRDEVGLVFQQVLEDAGVFKWTDTGKAALKRFLSAL